MWAVMQEKLFSSHPKSFIYAPYKQNKVIKIINKPIINQIIQERQIRM